MVICRTAIFALARAHAMLAKQRAIG